MKIDLNRIAFIGRTFHEYYHMLGLDHGLLRGRVLDCPAGASSFTAECARQGYDVTACDVGSQVRVYPLAGLDGKQYPLLGDLLAALSASGAETQVRPMPFRFMRGADRMLVITRPSCQKNPCKV